MVKRKRYLIWSMFIVYCGVMLWLLFGRSIHASGDDYVGSLIANINRIPFHTVLDQLQNLLNPPSPGLFTHAWINLGGNVAVFIPLGIFLPLIWPKFRRLGRFFLVSSGIILTVEFLQWITLRGILDVDDYILNMLGLFGGYVLFRLSARLMKKE
ncbi:MAG: VanZ family protein [Clostridia bacterium]|nr:VanZ family protein [Clostridia bacterium]